MRRRKTIADVLDKQSLRSTFLSKLITREDGCQIWSGSISFSGYGQLAFDGRTWSAHRLAYEIANGPISQDAQKWWVLHKCDNPACCNPDHLYLGDAKDNANDMIDRKRQRMGYKRYGGGEDVRFGRVFYEIGGEIKTLFQWAELFDVNQSTLEQRISAGWPEEDLSISSRVFKRHLKSDGQTKYKRFSGIEEVEKYKSEAPTAVTDEASVSTSRDGIIDMTSIAILEAVNTSHVPFNGQQIITAMAAGIAYVAMKPIVENLGMSWSTQVRKLTADKGKFNCVHMNMVATDSKLRDVLCIPLRKLNGWLFSINPEKVRADIRDKLIQYQEECFTVLHDYWNKGVAVNPRKAKTTVDERTPLRDAVNLLVGKKGLRYDDAYNMVHQRFSIDSIDALGLEQIPMAVEYVHRIALEGEFLGKQLELPMPSLDINYPAEWWDQFPLLQGDRKIQKSISASGFQFPVRLLFGFADESPSAIAVINPFSGSMYGHACIYDGQGTWYSDFTQRSMYPGPGYRKAAPAFKIYRHP